MVRNLDDSNLLPTFKEHTQFKSCEILKDYYKMRPSSLWVSLDFEWIWTFLPSEIV
jgi:hypothetical protein